ncbi:MAG: hypothetical protein WCP59_05720 [Actinomycetota bacterium]|jgi:hypothetical protein
MIRRPIDRADLDGLLLARDELKRVAAHVHLSGLPNPGTTERLAAAQPAAVADLR